MLWGHLHYLHNILPLQCEFTELALKQEDLRMSFKQCRAIIEILSIKPVDETFRFEAVNLPLMNDGNIMNMWAATWQNQQNECASAKTQISLDIRPVWSESLLSAWRKLGSLATHWAHSEDSDQTGLIWVFAGRTLTLWVLSCRGSCMKYCYGHIS